MLKIPLNKKTLIPMGMINGIAVGITICVISQLVVFFDWYWRNAQLSYFNFKELILIDLDRVLFLSVLFCIAATLAALIVDRYAARYTKSIFWFWQVIGILTLLVFALLLPIYSSYYIWKDSILKYISLEIVLNVIIGDLLTLPITLPVISIINLLFAFALKRFSKSLLP